MAYNKNIEKGIYANPPGFDEDDDWFFYGWQCNVVTDTVETERLEVRNQGTRWIGADAGRPKMMINATFYDDPAAPLDHDKTAQTGEWTNPRMSGASAVSNTAAPNIYSLLIQSQAINDDGLPFGIILTREHVTSGTAKMFTGTHANRKIYVDKARAFGVSVVGGGNDSGHTLHTCTIEKDVDGDVTIEPNM